MRTPASPGALLLLISAFRSLFSFFSHSLKSHAASLSLPFPVVAHTLNSLALVPTPPHPRVVRATRQTSGNKPYLNFNGVQVEQPDGSLWLAQNLTVPSSPDAAPGRLQRQRSHTSRVGGSGSWPRVEGGSRRADGGLQRTSSFSALVVAVAAGTAVVPLTRLEERGAQQARLGVSSSGAAANAAASSSLSPLPVNGNSDAVLNLQHALLRGERASIWGVSQAQQQQNSNVDEGDDDGNNGRGSEVETGGDSGRVGGMAAPTRVAPRGGIGRATGGAIPSFTQ